MRRRRGLLLIVAAVLVVSGCGAAGGPPAPIINMFTDPTGDEFGTGAGTDWDATTLQTTRNASTLTIDITFTTVPAIPAPGSFGGTGDVVGFLDFDTDQNPLTGGTPFTSLFCPAPGTIGMEYYIDLFFRNVSGGYDVYTSADVDTGDATPSVAGNTLTLVLPLTALGGDGSTDMDMTLGNGSEPTDCAPDAGAMPTRQPLRAQWRSRVHR